MMSPFSKRLTVPLTASPYRWLFREDILALGYAHFLENHLLGGHAAIRPSTSVTFGNSIVRRARAVGDLFINRAIVHLARFVIESGAALVTSWTTCLTANRST